MKYLAKMMALPAKPSQATSMKSPCSFSSRFDPAPTRTTSFRLSGSDVKLRSYKKKIKNRDKRYSKRNGNTVPCSRCDGTDFEPENVRK